MLSKYQHKRGVKIFPTAFRVIGITGNMAMGKTSVAQHLERQHILVFDADREIAQLYQQPAVRRGLFDLFPELPDPFPKGALYQILQDEEDALDKLQKLLYPSLHQAIQHFLKDSMRRRAPVVALDIPLLFEAGFDRYCTEVWTVSAPLFIQKQRLQQRLQRGVMTPKMMHVLRARQWPDIQKRQLADGIIETGHHAAALRTVMRLLASR